MEQYGYRGAILIMGGITLNTWVAALFYEPVENHMKYVKKQKIELLDRNGIIDEEDEGITLKFTNQSENGVEELLPMQSLANASDEEMPVIATKRNDMAFDLYKPERKESFARSVSAVGVQNIRSYNDEMNQRQRKISTPLRSYNVSKNDSFLNQLNSTTSLHIGPESRLSHSSRLNQGKMGYRPPKRSPSTSSFQYISTPYHGSTLSFQPAEFTSHLSLKSIASSINPIKACSKDQNKDKNKFIDLTLLKDPVYLVILISNCTNAIGYTNFIILLPTFAKTLGFDKNLGAYLLSIVSIFDLIGRIGGSAISDMISFIPKTWYFVGGLAMSGFSLFILSFTQTYSMVGFWCGMFGLASGTYVGITAVIMADMLGTERLTSSYGISLFVNGILQLVGPPICGKWYERNKSYSSLFSTLGITLLAGAAIWGFMPFIKRSRAQKEQKIQTISEDNENEAI